MSTRRTKTAVRKRLRRRRALEREFGKEAVDYVMKYMWAGYQAYLDSKILYGEGRRHDGMRGFNNILMEVDEVANWES